MFYDFIIVGAGYAGSICAREIAERLDKKVLLIDKRDHIAGRSEERRVGKECRL